MTVAEHYRTNLKLALPVMIGQLGHIMVSVADSIMVGQLGTIPLAAVALGNSVFGMFMVFGLGTSFGITPLVANADGKGRKHLQGSLLRHAFWVNMAVGLLLAIIMFSIAPFLQLFGQEKAVADLAQPYLILISSSIIPLMTFMTFKQFAEGLSDTRMAMVISLVCNLINVGLNYLLIYGKGGFPELGLNGAGWATIIARIIMVAGMWGYVMKANRFKIYDLRIWAISFRKKIARRLLQVGIPSGLQFTFEVSAFSLAAIFAGMLSAKALAAHQIAINIASVSYMAVTGLGAAATVRVGNQAGRRDKANLKTAASTIFKMSLVWMAFTGLVILLFRDTLAGFYSDDPDVLLLAGKMLILVVIFQLSDGLQAVAIGALRGFTDVRIPTVITFVAYWLMTLPAAYILSHLTPLGAMGIWYALAGGLTIAAVFLLKRFVNLVQRF
jgi:MATE family multidrug resistance protein